MTTVAAIDRLVHHSIILEMTETSARTPLSKQKRTQHRQLQERRRRVSSLTTRSMGKCNCR